MPNSEESLKTIIIDMIRTETAKREMKRRKIEAVHPEQILVRHARKRISSIIFDFKPLAAITIKINSNDQSQAW